MPPTFVPPSRPLPSPGHGSNATNVAATPSASFPHELHRAPPPIPPAPSSHASPWQQHEPPFPEFSSAMHEAAPPPPSSSSEPSLPSTWPTVDPMALPPRPPRPSSSSSNDLSFPAVPTMAPATPTLDDAASSAAQLLYPVEDSIPPPPPRPSKDDCCSSSIVDIDTANDDDDDDDEYSDEDDDADDDLEQRPPPPPRPSDRAAFDVLYPMRMMLQQQQQQAPPADLSASAPDLPPRPASPFGPGGPPPPVSRLSKPQLTRSAPAPPVNRASKPPAFFQEAMSAGANVEPLDEAAMQQREAESFADYAGVGQEFASAYGCSYGNQGDPTAMYQRTDEVPGDDDDAANEASLLQPENAEPIYRNDASYPPTESVLSILQYPPVLAVSIPLGWLFEIVKVPMSPMLDIGRLWPPFPLSAMIVMMTTDTTMRHPLHDSCGSLASGQVQVHCQLADGRVHRARRSRTIPPTDPRCRASHRRAANDTARRRSAEPLTVPALVLLSSRRPTLSAGPSEVRTSSLSLLRSLRCHLTRTFDQQAKS